jgi:serine/threonine protein kinase
VGESSSSLETSARARLGQWLREKYRLDGVLGVGGMASVYVVTHRNGRRFALKMLHTELSVRHDVRRRFLREGYIANVVDHPGAVAVLDDDVTEDGAAFLVMELLDGETVDAILERDGKLPEGAVLALAAETLDVLAAAHARNVVHRDIKPANLFVTRSGEVKVLDFGIARLRAAESSSATSTGLALGTPAFMSPEQALGREIDGRSDVFSVGAMMFTLLTGQYVHQGEAGQELMVRAATEPARPLVALAPDVSAATAALVDRALAFSALDRWQTASEMRNEVRSAYSESHGSATQRARLAGLVTRAGPTTFVGVQPSSPNDPTAVAPGADSNEQPTPRMAPKHLVPVTQMAGVAPPREPLTVAGVASEAGEALGADLALPRARRSPLVWAGIATLAAVTVGVLLLVKLVAPTTPASAAATAPSATSAPATHAQSVTSPQATAATAEPLEPRAAAPATASVAAASVDAQADPQAAVAATPAPSPARRSPPAGARATATPARPAPTPTATVSIDPLAP